QWYTATDTGRSIVADPRALAALRDGETTASRPAATAPPRPGRLTAWDRGEAVRAAFVPDGRLAPVLYAVMAAQVVVFAAGQRGANRLGHGQPVDGLGRVRPPPRPGHRLPPGPAAVRRRPA